MSRSLLIILVAIWMFGCEERKHDGQTLLLDWKDVEQQATFRVTEAPNALVKHNSRLHVELGGSDRFIRIDDDAMFSTVAFVRHDHWLLVVCRGLDEVWAGYDYDTGRLYGEGQWGGLPFTKWAGQGKVVAERKIRDEGYRPAQFPRP